MRKEFEEKEKSTSEENIRTSVEDMTDEEFQKFLEEQYIKEAEERQKELFADQMCIRDRDKDIYSDQTVQLCMKRAAVRLPEKRSAERCFFRRKKKYAAGTVCAVNRKIKMN